MPSKKVKEGTRVRTEHQILLTGGTGQLGTATVKALRRHGWQVRVLTRHPASDKE